LLVEAIKELSNKKSLVVNTYDGENNYPDGEAGMIIFDSFLKDFKGYNGIEWITLSKKE
jgi:hypothetical protein